MGNYHVPVMLKEVEEFLITDTKGTYVDCTLGGGGHSEYFLSKHNDIRVIALDCDKDAVEEAEKKLEKFKSRLTIIKDNFRNLKKALESHNVSSINGVLIDLGVSSHQFDNLERGFSFKSANMDMRMDTTLNQTAYDILNTCTQDELSDIFYNYADEFKSRQISREIINLRNRGEKVTSEALNKICSRVKHGDSKINPATKVYQALRIAVNDELKSLSEVLSQIPGLLADKGRVVILSYHSIEDRIVKQNFRELAGSGVYKLLNKKVIIASDEEISANPRSRSAKLRAAERVF